MILVCCIAILFSFISLKFVDNDYIYLEIIFSLFTLILLLKKAAEVNRFFDK